MAKFITIPIKSNTPESFKLIDERTEEIRVDKEEAALMNKEPSTIKILEDYQKKIDDTYIYSDSRLNVDMIIGYHKDGEDEKLTIINMISSPIVTNLSVEELDKLLL